MDTLFGAEMPLAVRFFIAFLVVLGLIGLTAWVVRRFGADRLGGAAARGRAPRLAVIDAASVDSRRRLIIIRRDNVEHLLMIGGPTDVVVETNIIRAVGAQREPAAAPRTAAVDTLPRAVPLGDGSWQPQPEPAVRASREDAGQWHPPEPPQRPTPRAADALAGIAAELSARPVSASGLDVGASPALHRNTQAEPTRGAAPAPEPSGATPGDQNLAEMAQRLEAALRRPGATNTPRAVDAKPRPEPVASAPPVQSPRAVAEPSRGAEAKPAPAAGRSKSMYDSLEQEMASLLGRPNKS